MIESLRRMPNLNLPSYIKKIVIVVARSVTQNALNCTICRLKFPQKNSRFTCPDLLRRYPLLHPPQHGHWPCAGEGTPNVDLFRRPRFTTTCSHSLACFQAGSICSHVFLFIFPCFCTVCFIVIISVFATSTFVTWFNDDESINQSIITQAITQSIN